VRGCVAPSRSPFAALTRRHANVVVALVLGYRNADEPQAPAHTLPLACGAPAVGQQVWTRESNRVLPASWFH
jgi:hypothetical protein